MSAIRCSICTVPECSRFVPSSAPLSRSEERFQALRLRLPRGPLVLLRNRPCPCEQASLEDSRSKPPGDSILERSTLSSKRRRPAISSYVRQRPPLALASQMRKQSQRGSRSRLSDPVRQ